jgi:stage V sporulation protein G
VVVPGISQGNPVAEIQDIREDLWEDGYLPVPEKELTEMEITNVRIHLGGQGKVKASASIVIDDCFVVRGLKVIDGVKGHFVGMPSEPMPKKSGNRNPSMPPPKRKDIAFPTNIETRKMIEDKVLDAYEEALNKKTHVQEKKELPQA